jgi:hypothetical protein
MNLFLLQRRSIVIVVTLAHTVMATASRLREVALLWLELAAGDTDAEVEVEA